MTSIHILRERAVTLLLLAAFVLPLLVPVFWRHREAQAPWVVWERIDQEMISHAPVIALATDSADPQVVYAGAHHDPGLYETTDGAESWRALNHGLEGLAVFALLIDPRDSQD